MLKDYISEEASKSEKRREVTSRGGCKLGAFARHRSTQLFTYILEFTLIITCNLWGFISTHQ